MLLSAPLMYSDVLEKIFQGKDELSSCTECIFPFKRFYDEFFLMLNFSEVQLEL